MRSVDGNLIAARGQTGMNLPELASRPEPDVFWVNAKRYLNAHPTAADTKLAIEVSDSSFEADRTEKAELYALAGIAEYWIVDVKKKCIHAMRECSHTGTYDWIRTFHAGEQFSPLAEPTAKRDISDLFGLN